MVVRFTLDDEDVELTPEYLEDWIDPRIISSINERIAASGRQFTLVKAFDQTAFLLALDQASGLPSKRADGASSRDPERPRPVAR